MENIKADVAVIGAGPGGYVAAIRCRQLGLSVVCIDKRSTLGGTCLNVGCIPSKTLLDMAHHFHEARNNSAWFGVSSESFIPQISTIMERKDKVIHDLTQGIHFLFRKHEVISVQGEARFQDPYTLHVTHEGTHTHVIEARHIIIATGSESASLPHLPIDEDKVLSSTGALTLQQIPQRLLVVGTGYIGLELGLLWHHLGTQITMVEASDQLLPAMDTDLGAHVQKILSKQGIHGHRGHQVKHIEPKEDTLQVHIEPVSGGAPQVLETDKVLIAVGRRPHTHHLGLEAVNIVCDEKGFIPVHAHGQTKAHPHIFAIGDVTAGPMLAHRASEEAILVSEHIAGAAPRALNLHHIPSVIFLSPEIASVGRTEQTLKEEGVPYKTGRFSFSANSRARAVGATDGFIKILAHADSDEILGVHIVGPEASTMIGQAVLALEYGASSEDLARICYAHPTFTEAMKEAALAVSGSSLHA